MKNELIKKYIQISRIIMTIMVFIVLNIWFLFENDPQWILALIISVLVFITNYPSSRICLFVIKKGDKITKKILKVFYYLFILPIIFLLILIITGLLCALIVSFFEDSLTLGMGVLIACAGVGLFTCILIPYFQTLIILIFRSKKLNFKNTNKI